VADIEELKRDIDKLADTMRKSEKDIYIKIDATNANVSDLNTSIKLVVEKLSTFIETFKKHDTNEMQKYDDILIMFKKSQEDTKILEEKISNKYITKSEMQTFQDILEENSRAIKQGFKIFYIGSGLLLSLSLIGGLIMWILNLISQLQSVGAIK